MARKEMHHWNAGIECNQCATRTQRNTPKATFVPPIVAVRFFKHHFFRRYRLTVGSEKCSVRG